MRKDSELNLILVSLKSKPIIFHGVYAEITGSVKAGLLLAQVIYWDYRMNREFYKTDKEFSKELGMKIDEFKSAKKKVSKFVNIRKRGIPPTTYYRLKRDVLISTLISLVEYADENEELPEVEDTFYE